MPNSSGPCRPAWCACPITTPTRRITGFDGDFAAGSDGKSEWLLHCYGSVGAGRDNAPDSGSGVELYAVTGQAPRQLDRNITLVGRVVQGMELLSSLPRGGSAQGAYMGFYQSPSQYTKIKSIRLASDLAAGPAPEAGISQARHAILHRLCRSAPQPAQ